VLDIVGGLLAMVLSVAIVQLVERAMASRGRPVRIPTRVRRRDVGEPQMRPQQRAYRMSQTCYEVGERVE
jgi:hypothetical protein